MQVLDILAEAMLENTQWNRYLIIQEQNRPKRLKGDVVSYKLLFLGLFSVDMIEESPYVNIIPKYWNLLPSRSE